MLRGDPGASISQLAAEVIGAYGGLLAGQVAGSERYYEYRIMRQLDLSALLQRAMRLDGEIPRRALAARGRRRGAGAAGAGAAGRDRQGTAGSPQLSWAAPSPHSAGSAKPCSTRSSCARARPSLRRCGRSSVARPAARGGGAPPQAHRAGPASWTCAGPCAAPSPSAVFPGPAWRRRRRSRPRLLVLCDVSGSVSVREVHPVPAQRAARGAARLRLRLRGRRRGR